MAYSAPGMTLAEIVTAIQDAFDWTNPTTAQNTKTYQAITAAGLAATTWQGRLWWWMQATGHFQTNTKTVAAIADDGATRSSNVSTITTTAVHGLAIGQFVKISSVSDTTFNGTWEVADVPSTTTLTFNQVADDVAAKTAGTGTVSVISYPLRTIDLVGSASGTATMAETWGIRRVYYSDKWIIQPLRWSAFRGKMRLLETTGISKPFNYAIYGDPLSLCLWPAPGDAYDIYIDLIRRHSKITSASADTDLLIPGEFQWGIYVQAAIWLLRHETVEPASLAQCEPFMEAIGRMATASPAEYGEINPDDLYADAQAGKYPNDRRVWIDEGGVLIQNPVSV